MTVLDEAENLLIKYKIDLTFNVDIIRWHKPVPANCIPQSIISSLLSCALAMNLSDYVVAKLLALNIHNSDAGKIAATQMLSAGVRRYGGTRPDDFGTISMKMATALIQQGADLNFAVEKGPRDTTWTSLLVAQVRDPLSRESKPIDPEFPKLMSVALSSGADPYVIISLGVQIQPCTLAAYVENYVRPKYPAEADNVMNVIQRATSEHNHQKKSIMDFSINKVNFRKTTTDGVVIVKSKKRHWWKRVS
jgi:hypothetical protein